MIVSRTHSLSETSLAFFRCWYFECETAQIPVISQSVFRSTALPLSKCFTDYNLVLLMHEISVHKLNGKCFLSLNMTDSFPKKIEIVELM